MIPPDSIDLFKKTTRFLGIVLMFTMAAFLPTACSGSREPEQQQVQASRGESSQSQLQVQKSSVVPRITVGSAGGITGGGGGFEIRGDGVVSEYSYFPGHKDTVLRSAIISLVTADSIFSAFRSSRAFSDSSNLPSNMTSSIGYQSAEIKRHWSWPMGDVRTDVNARLQGEYEVLQRFCRSILDSGK